MAKLRCILHYFERVEEDGLERPGSITFRRQVGGRVVKDKGVNWCMVVWCTLALREQQFDVEPAL